MISDGAKPMDFVLLLCLIWIAWRLLNGEWHALWWITLGCTAAYIVLRWT